MEILNTTEIMTTDLTLNVILACICIVSFAITVILNKPAKDSGALAIVGIITGCISLITCIAIIVLGVIKPVPSGRMRVEAIIGEDAAFHEIYDKYDIVEQRGEVFILEEKEASVSNSHS